MHSENPLTFKKHPQVEKMKPENWSTMLPEIMEMISDRLPVKDFLSFRSVCKPWQSLPSGRSHISKFSTDKLWFLIHESHEEKCYLYSCIDSKPCTFYLHDLKGATVMHSKFGWLIARKNNHFFIYNFFTLTKIDLPDHAVSKDQACTFTTLPLHKDCMVFVVTRKCDEHVEVSSCRVGDKKWEVESLNIKRSMMNVLAGVVSCNCSPDGKNCTCTLKNRILLISGEGKYVRYNYVKKHIVFNAASRYENSHDEVEWEHDIKALHMDEWMHRFGSEKGLAVRICALSYRIDKILGLKGDVRYVDANADSVQNYNLVKAAIIESPYLGMEAVGERV